MNGAVGRRQAFAAAWAAIGLGTVAWVLLDPGLPHLRLAGMPSELYGPLAAVSAFVLGCLALAWALLHPRPYLVLLAYVVTVPFTLACAWALVWCGLLLLADFSAPRVGLAAVPLAFLYFASETRRLCRSMNSKSN